MKKRNLGRTGLEVSEVGFGAWAIGADWGEEVDAGEARGALQAAIEAGMTLIDTADIYGAGRSETLVGEVLREHSGTRIHVATKMGRGPGWDDGYDAIARAAEGSIERLGVEALDLVQLHCVPFDTLKAGRVFEGLEKAKEQGLIRHYGVSIETIEEGLFCIENTGTEALQVIFNLFRQRVSRDLLPAAEKAGVGILARVPLASGILSGKFRADHRFHDEDHRHFNANGELFNVGETFAGVAFAEGIGFAQTIAEILADENEGATLAQKSLRWILDHPAVSTVIPGAKSPEQARANAAASDLAPTSKAAMDKLRELYQDEIDAAVRGAY